MKWFDILKVLGTKTGFSQLDFDNIVIEDDDNCKKRWQKNVEAYGNFAKRDFKYRRKNAPIGEQPYVDGYVMPKSVGISSTSYSEPKRKDSHYSKTIILLQHLYSPDIPEEVYCKALEMWDKNTTDEIDMEGYKITNTNIPDMNLITIKKDNFPIAYLAYYVSMKDEILIDQKDGTMYDSRDKLVEKIKGLKI
tara:strand:- start:946 stop:1524 length:579 start_codon:yes stop_codon:yes gene_type:complete